MLERISTHRGASVLRTAASAIAAGLLLFASVFAEYLFSAENDGKVTAEYSRGYKFGDRLLRPAKVQVGRGRAQSAGE